jgi:hypothetical protein
MLTQNLQRREKLCVLALGCCDDGSHRLVTFSGKGKVLPFTCRFEELDLEAYGMWWRLRAIEIEKV